MKFSIGIDLTDASKDDACAGGGCGWEWFCHKCGREYCSGCCMECPQCGSLQISFKGWNTAERTEKDFLDQFGEKAKIIYGTFWQWLKIWWWNLRHPEYTQEDG